MTRTVRDAAILLGGMAGFDPKDSTSAEIDTPDFESLLDSGVHGLRVGIPAEYAVDGMNPEIAALWDQGRAWLKDTVGMKSGQIKSLEEPFLSLQKAVSEEETTKSGYKRLPQSERVQRAIEAACTQAEDKFGEKTPAWILWIREHKAIVGGIWRCVFVVGKVYVWFYTRVAMVVRALRTETAQEVAIKTFQRVKIEAKDKASVQINIGHVNGEQQ